MLTVATVFKTGGEYKPEHVHRLRHQVLAASTVSTAFVCLTDHPDMGDTNVLPLEHGWPKWWSKIELFKHDWIWPVVYLDLDTDVLQCCSLLRRQEFTMLSDFNWPQYPASGVMAWGQGNQPTEVYDLFRQNSSRYISEYQKFPDKWGDQGFTGKHAKTISRFRPGEVLSYKLHVKPKGVIPEDAVALAYHGRPKPWEVDPSALPVEPSRVVE